jgi:hypothetical protein
MSAQYRGREKRLAIACHDRMEYSWMAVTFSFAKSSGETKGMWYLWLRVSDAGSKEEMASY